MRVNPEKQAGFTLIELVVVIVILGILAATALPKFTDLSGEAEQAAVQGVAGALSSAGTINYAKAKVGSAGAVAVTATTGDACASLTGSGMLIGSVSLVTTTPTNTSQYKIAADTAVGAVANCASAGSTLTCKLTSKSSKTAIAYIPCTG